MQIALSYCLVFFCFNLKVPFSTAYREGLVVIESLAFCLSGKDLISPLILPDVEVLLKNSFIQHFKYYHLNIFWDPQFLTRNLLSILLRVLCV
jgi:hypothetical protein